METKTVVHMGKEITVEVDYFGREWILPSNKEEAQRFVNGLLEQAAEAHTKALMLKCEEMLMRARQKKLLNRIEELKERYGLT